MNSWRVYLVPTVDNCQHTLRLEKQTGATTQTILYVKGANEMLI